MLWLLLFWAALGMLVALVARAAHPWPARLRTPRWRSLLGEGALAGLLGGWLGSLIFGRFYGAPNALWFSAVLLVAGPWLAPRLRASRLGRRLADWMRDLERTGGWQHPAPTPPASAEETESPEAGG